LECRCGWKRRVLLSQISFHDERCD
jgi:hypothetical protein